MAKKTEKIGYRLKKMSLEGMVAKKSYLQVREMYSRGQYFFWEDKSIVSSGGFTYYAIWVHNPCCVTHIRHKKMQIPDKIGQSGPK